MTDTVLRVIIGAAVALACALIAAMWQFFRSRSRRTKKMAIFTAVGLVALVVAYAVARHQWLNRIRTGPDPRLEQMADFTESNRGRIETLGKRLAGLRALVAKDGWLPQGEQTHEGEDQPALVFWTHDLVGQADG